MMLNTPARKQLIAWQPVGLFPWDALGDRAEGGAARRTVNPWRP